MHEQDLKMIKALFHILETNGSFSLKAREAIAFTVVYKWLKNKQENLEQKIKEKKEIHITENDNGD